MGNSESNPTTLNKTGDAEGNIQKDQQEQDNKNYPNNIHETYLRHNESIIESSKPFIDLKQDISKRLSKEICSVVIDAKERKNTGTGFILAFPVDLEWFYCLVSNEHIISNDSINNNRVIYITYEEYKTASIKLDKNKRYIRSFIDKKLDITVVEILDEDNISKKNYLFPELDIPIDNKLINKEIYIPQYIEEKKLKNAEGIIKYINKFELCYSVNTKQGSSGSPIFLKNSNKVIGIHKAGVGNIENIGDFIYPILIIIK